MPTDSQAVSQLFLQAGALATFFQGAGAAAWVAAIITLLGTLFGFRSRALRTFAVLTMLAVLSLLGAGAYGTYTAYEATAAAAAKVTPASASERQKRAGYEQARANLVLALGLCAVPIGLGLLGLVVAGRRRWRDDPDSPQRLRGLVGLVVFLDLAGFAAEALAWKLPLPGRDLDQSGWKVVELEEAIERQHFEACLTFDTPIEKVSRARKLAQFKGNQRRCVEHFVKADPKAVPDAAGDLKRLLEAKWLEDDGLRAKARARLEELSRPPPPTPEEVEAARKKTLAQEEEAGRTQVTDVARTCLGQAAKKAKKLKLSVTLEVTVVATGEVKTVEVTKGALKPPALKTCVLDAAKKLKLPNTSGADRKLVVPVAR